MEKKFINPDKQSIFKLSLWKTSGKDGNQSK
jgi:hypothetical protein